METAPRRQAPAARSGPNIRDPGVDNGGDFPNGAAVVAPGSLQIELDPTYQGTNSPFSLLLHRIPGATDAFAIPTLVRIGLLERLELRLGASVFDFQTGSGGSMTGAGPINVGGKFLVGGGGGESIWRPAAIGIEAQVQLPVGSPAFDGDVAQPSASVNLDYDLPGNFTGSVNVGPVAPLDGTGKQFLQACLQWSVGYDVNPDLNLFVNGLTEYPASASGSGTVNQLGVGWMWYLGDRTALSGAYNFGLNSTSPDLGVSLGFAVQL